MFLKYSIESFYQHLEDTLNFNYLKFKNEDGTSTNKWWFYNPTNFFENELGKRLAWTLYSEREDEYVSSFWSRAHLDPVPYQARQQNGMLKNVDLGLGNGYRMKILKCPMTVTFFSNSPDYLESFEELFLVFYDRTISLSSEYQIPYNFQDLGKVLNVLDSKTIEVQGLVEDATLGEKLTVKTATADVILTLESVAHTSNTTKFSVLENVTPSLKDCKIYRNDGFVACPVNIFMTDIIFSGFEKLETTSRGEMIFLSLNFNLDYPVVYRDKSSKIITTIMDRTKPLQVLPEISLENPDEPYDTTIIP